MNNILHHALCVTCECTTSAICSSVVYTDVYLLYCVQYPYIPAHVTKPKEHKRLYLVQLPEKGLLYCTSVVLCVCTLLYWESVL